MAAGKKAASVVGVDVVARLKRSNEAIISGAAGRHAPE